MILMIGVGIMTNDGRIVLFVLEEVDDGVVGWKHY